METISLVPQTLMYIGDFQVNQAIFSATIVTTLLLVLGIFFKATASIIPTKPQVILESVYSLFYNQNKSDVGDKPIVPLYTGMIFSLFLFIFISNQFTLIPLIQSIQFDGNKLFIPSTSHLSQTLALSLFIVVLSHLIALKISPLKHIDNIFNFSGIFIFKSVKEIPFNLLNIFLSLLNVVGEIAKVISLACRLFGNVFAGEVMIAVIAGLSIFTTFIVPIPFIVLSIFSGMVQAFVFAILSMSFINSSVKSVSS